VQVLLQKPTANFVPESQETWGALTVKNRRKPIDFCDWVAYNQETLQGKRVLLYCTGGIRCERASARFNQVLKSGAAQVYQL
jgi:predicted sulfurtransferase